MTGAYAGFGGRVGRTFAGSESWWPARPAPPAGAPNVVVILADDLGYSDLGCYGGEVATPHLDALAARGVRFTDFHVTPMCSPTRAALLTGVNSHLAGVGHVAHSDAGFPGYASELADDVATMAEILRGHGYATLMVGKWHLTKDSDCSDAGPRDSWPCQRGFDRFYGFLDGFTNLHQPHRLVEDNHQVEVDRYPDGYFLTDDLTDRAISMIRERRASNPHQPFFCYFSHAAVHAPLHAKPDDIAKYADRYHGGWDRLREERFARQVELGIVDPDTVLPARNAEEDHDVAAWADLSDTQRELFARYMAVYAAMVESIDRSWGRLRDALAESGDLENTIVMFLSDNGASREGEASGTTGYYVHLLGESDTDADHARLGLIGGPRTIPHYPRGWAMASNTPWRLYKVNTHAGGHRVPFVVSWPAGLPDGGGLRAQYAHVTDVLPTLLDLIGVDRPTERAGRPLQPLAGTSLVPVLRDPEAPAGHTEQYYEMSGHRGMYREGWEVVTLHRPMTPFSDEEWELYHVAEDPTEVRDLAAERPEKVSELAAAWEEAAWSNQVYPLDEGSFVKFAIRPERSAVYGEPVTIRPGTPTLERWRSSQLIWLRSYVVRIRFEHAPGARGYLLAHGDQGGGYGVYVDADEVRYVHNDGRGVMHTLDAGPVTAGEHEVVVDVTAPGQSRWDVVLRVDGVEGATESGLAMLFPMAPFEGIDVGIDRRSPVSWEIYERDGVFAYPGRIEWVRYEPGDPAPDSAVAMLDVLWEMGRQFE